MLLNIFSFQTRDLFEIPQVGDEPENLKEIQFAPFI